MELYDVGKLYKNYDFQWLFCKAKMRSEITAAKTQETLEQEKLCPKEQPDFLFTDPLFSHRLTLTTPIQIQQTAYMFQTDE